MKKNNTLITAVLYFILTMAGCGNNVEKKFAENQAKKFQEVTKALHMEGDAPLADTLFHYSVPTPGQGNGAFIYVVNPECSFCIQSLSGFRECFTLPFSSEIIQQQHLRVLPERERLDFSYKTYKRRVLNTGRRIIFPSGKESGSILPLELMNGFT